MKTQNSDSTMSLGHGTTNPGLARFNLTLATGMRISISLYPAEVGSLTSAATIVVPGIRAPLINVFDPRLCTVQRPGQDSTLPPALWLGTLIIELEDDEATALEQFIDQARAGQLGGV